MLAPVQCQAVAVCQAAKVAQALPMLMEGGANAKVAGHAIHMLLMRGQHLVRWRVSCMPSDSYPLQKGDSLLMTMCSYLLRAEPVLQVLNMLSMRCIY